MFGLLENMLVGQKSTSPRILIVDDEPRWLDFFSHDDLDAMFDVEIATTLEAALEELGKENHFELIIVSSRCPDVLEMLQKQHPDKRVVVATGHPTTREAIKMYRLGALDYFAKDLRYEVVSEKINEALQKPAPALA